VPRLTIVIPCLGGAAEFDGTLVSVLQHRPADCEIVVVHRDPYDDPYDLAGEVRFIHRADATTLTSLVNAGLSEASGEVLHLVTCGLEATEGWTDGPLAVLDDEEIAAVSPAIVTPDTRYPQGERLVAAGVCCTTGGGRRVLGDRRLMVPGSGHLRAEIAGPTLQAGFFRIDVLQALQGWDERAGDELADVFLALAIEKLDLRVAFEPSCRLIQSGAQPAFATAVETGNALVAGRAAERLFWTNAAGEPALPRILPHLGTIAWDSLRHLASPGLSLGRLLGRAAGLLELGAVRRWEARLDSAAQALSESRSRAASDSRSRALSDSRSRAATIPLVRATRSAPRPSHSESAIRRAA
jgi:hypothetical protein